MHAASRWAVRPQDSVHAGPAGPENAAPGARERVRGVLRGLGAGVSALLGLTGQTPAQKGRKEGDREAPVQAERRLRRDRGSGGRHAGAQGVQRARAAPGRVHAARLVPGKGLKNQRQLRPVRAPGDEERKRAPRPLLGF